MPKTKLIITRYYTSMLIQEAAPWEILSFEASIYQWTCILNQPPTLLGKNCQVKTPNVPKPNAPFLLWFRHWIPTLSMDLPFITHLTPPKSCTHDVKFITKLQRQLENSHSVCENWLSYSFDKYLLPRPQQ